MLWTIIVFVFVLGVLVFVHEAGHFLVARWHGIKAEEFGFGFPPRLIGIVWNKETKRYRLVRSDRKEGVTEEKPLSFKTTIYSLNWIPFGGFVRIKGEDGSGQLEPDSFAAKKAWPRIQVLAAGVVMNFLLAWILLSGVVMLGFPAPGVEGSGPVTIQIQNVLPDTPARNMGLHMGDAIQSIDDHTFSTVTETSQYIQQHKGHEISIRIDRGGKTLQVQGVPRVEYPKNEGSLGIELAATTLIRYSFFPALGEGARQTYELTRSMAVGLGKMVTGQGKLSDVSGPVGIAQYTRQASDLGVTHLLFFMAILSINLGIINALPIPAIDGGRILFILIEMVRGKPVSQRMEGWFHSIGFLLLLVLMLVVTLHDILKTSLFVHFFG
jgi:regulator of sigma E protease